MSLVSRGTALARRALPVGTRRRALLRPAALRVRRLWWLGPSGVAALVRDDVVRARDRVRSARPDRYERLVLVPSLDERDAERLRRRSWAPAQRHRPTVVALPVLDWSFRHQRPQHLMAEVARRGYRVVYVSLFHLPAGAGVRRRQVAPNVEEVTLPLPTAPAVYADEVDARPGGELATALDAAVGPAAHGVAWAMIPSWRAAALHLRRERGWPVVYDCMDEWEHFHAVGPRVAEAERRLVGEADLVLVTAAALERKWRGRAARLVVVPNAADWEHFAHPVPPTPHLADVDGPVVGYFGAIAPWFDVATVAAAARRRPTWTFVLVGRVSDVDVGPLVALTNVRLEGERPYEDMPAYLARFDACLVPFVDDPVTRATNPVKVYEYLAGGKPVVAPPLPELDGAPVAVAADVDELVAALDAVVDRPDPDAAAARRAYASKHTWRVRGDTVAAELSALLPSVAVVVVTYGNLALTHLCLESLVRNLDLLDYRVVVVDNASSDGTPEFLRAAARADPRIVPVLNTENVGFAAANNQGVAATDAEHVVLLNNDTVVPPLALGRLLRHLRDPSVGLVGPLTSHAGNEARVDVPYTTWRQMERWAVARMQSARPAVADIETLAMFCVALRRETFDRIGPLDEGYGVGMFEDDDYARRVRQAGLRVVCASDAFVHHFGSAAFGRLPPPEYQELFDRNRGRFEQRWGPWTPPRSGSLDFEPHTP